MRPVLEALISAIQEVRKGELDPRQAQAMASLAGAAVRTHEICELQDRIQQLEADREAP